MHYGHTKHIPVVDALSHPSNTSQDHILRLDTSDLNKVWLNKNRATYS